MSGDRILRVWLGWRAPALAKDAHGWQAFLAQLGERFIPATWRIMPRFTLQAYVPSMLTPSQEGRPEEVAVLVYADEQAYESSKHDPDGKMYRDMHAEVFTFEQGPRQSRSRNARADSTKHGLPRSRADPQGAVSFESPDARIHLLLLAHDAMPPPDMLMRALHALSGEIIVLTEPRYALIWLVTRQTLQSTDVLPALNAAIHGLQLVTWHAARRVDVLPASGLTVHDDLSLHFQDTRIDDAHLA